MPAPKEEQSHANYDVLIRLEEGQDGMRKSFEKFTQDQEIENKVIHARIDATQKEFLTAVGTLKEGMAERGRINPSHIAIILSLFAIISGAGATYVQMQLNPVEKQVIANASKITSSETERMLLSKDLQSIAVETAVADAESKTDRAWIIKLMDELRGTTNTAQP